MGYFKVLCENWNKTTEKNHDKSQDSWQYAEIRTRHFEITNTLWTCACSKFDPL